MSKRIKIEDETSSNGGVDKTGKFVGVEDEKLLKVESQHLNYSMDDVEESSRVISYDELPEVPNQPEDVPPFRDRRRPHFFQRKWYKEYPWLHYDLHSEKMFCFQCLSGILRNGAESPLNNAFTRGGFRNWKKGIERFKSHENSQIHRATAEFSVNTILALKLKCKGVESVVTSLNYLLGLCYDIRQPHLFQLLNLRKPELPQLEEFLREEGFTQSDERALIGLMAASTMKTVSLKIKEAGRYGLILDTIQVHGQTMISVSVRICRNMRQDELFLGLYTEQNISHELANYLDADDLALYSCDLIESKSTVDALESVQPHALSICSAQHDLCANLQHKLKMSTEVGGTLLLLEELLEALKSSSVMKKCLQPPKQEFNKMFLSFQTITAIVSNFRDVVEELDETASSKPNHFSLPLLYSELQKPKTLFNLLLCKVLFYPLENLQAVLDKADSIKCVRDAVDSVVNVLESFHREKEFDNVWCKFVEACSSYQICSGRSLLEEMKRELKSVYVGVINETVEYLKSIFHCKGFQDLVLLEDALLREEDKFKQEISKVLVSNNVSPDAFEMEKRMLNLMASEGSRAPTLSELLAQISDMKSKSSTFGLIPEIIKVVDLLMLAKVVKNYDGPNVKQKNLRKFLSLSQSPDMINEMCILFVYKDEPFMNLNEVVQRFASSES